MSVAGEAGRSVPLGVPSWWLTEHGLEVSDEMRLVGVAELSAAREQRLLHIADG